MDLTDVRVEPCEEGRLKARASLVAFGCLAVKDVKVIEARRGLVVSMPSRRRQDACPACRGKNYLAASWCNWCGARLPDDRVPRLPDGRPDAYFDLVFPTHPSAREGLEDVVIGAYRAELERRESRTDADG